MSKSAEEKSTFTDFAGVSGLLIDLSSVQSRQPPEPDIWCTVHGAPYYFELGRLLDRASPPLRLAALRNAPNPVAVDPSKFGLPERDMLRQKISKTYTTNGIPVDLILFYDWGNLITDSVPPPFDLTPQFIEDVVLPELRNGTGPFARIWIFERIRPSVLWKFPV